MTVKLPFFFNFFFRPSICLLLHPRALTVSSRRSFVSALQATQSTLCLCFFTLESSDWHDCLIITYGGTFVCVSGSARWLFPVRACPRKHGLSRGHAGFCGNYHAGVKLVHSLPLQVVVTALVYVYLNPLCFQITARADAATGTKHLIFVIINWQVVAKNILYLLHC